MFVIRVTFVIAFVPAPSRTGRYGGHLLKGFDGIYNI